MSTFDDAETDALEAAEGEDAPAEELSGLSGQLSEAQKMLLAGATIRQVMAQTGLKKHQVEKLRGHVSGQLPDRGSNEDPYNPVSADVWVPAVLAGEPIPYILKGIIQPAGLTLLVGEPKVAHKSWHALMMAIAAATGKKLGTYEPSAPVKTLYTELEAGQRPMAVRIAMLCNGAGLSSADLGNLDILQGRSFYMDLQGEADMMVALVKERGYKVIFIDVFANAFQGDENRVKDVMQALKVTRRLKHECGCATVLVHHTKTVAKRNKSTALEPTAEMRGSSALKGAYHNMVAIQTNFIEQKEHMFLVLGGKDEPEGFTGQEIKWDIQPAPEGFRPELGTAVLTTVGERKPASDFLFDDPSIDAKVRFEMQKSADIKERIAAKEERAAGKVHY